MTQVCVAGATGWAGSALAAAVLEADDLRLRSAVSRSSAGEDLGAGARTGFRFEVGAGMFAVGLAHQVLLIEGAQEHSFRLTFGLDLAQWIRFFAK